MIYRLWRESRGDRLASGRTDPGGGGRTFGQDDIGAGQDRRQSAGLSVMRSRGSVPAAHRAGGHDRTRRRCETHRYTVGGTGQSRRHDSDAGRLSPGGRLGSHWSGSACDRARASPPPPAFIRGMRIRGVTAGTTPGIDRPLSTDGQVVRHRGGLCQTPPVQRGRYPAEPATTPRTGCGDADHRAGTDCFPASGRAPAVSPPRPGLRPISSRRRSSGRFPRAAVRRRAVRWW